MSDILSLFDALRGETLYKEQIPSSLMTDFVGTRAGHADYYFKPFDEDSVASCLSIAHEHQIPVTIRGAGTNLVGSTVPDNGLVLDLSALNRILELDEENMCVTVEPGVLLKDLIDFVQSKGYFYPPDPAEKNASIGGNVATNAGGMRAVKYGVTRDYVLALDVIKSDGTKISIGSRTRKDTTGLSLKHLIIGSEGTLGVITRITLKLLPLPDYTQSAVIAYHALADAIASVNVILKGNLEPTAIEFVEKRCIALGERYLNSEFPCRDADSYLIVTFDGTKEMVTERLNCCKNLVLAHGAYEFIALDDEEVSKNVWAIRSALALAVKAAGVWEPVDTVVPIGSIAKFVEKCREISSAHGVRIVPFGHAGDGNVHLCIIKDAIPDAKWPEILDSTLDALYNCAYELGGLISAEHGIGKAKRRYFLKHINKEARELMLGIKQAFDPLNLFNQHDGYTR